MKNREKTGLISAAGENLPGFGQGPYPGNACKIWLEVLAVLTLLCFNSLTHNNMAVNEIDRLTVARQYVDPSWIPGDWYLNQPIGYQALFADIFGRLAAVWGFLATSLAGRFLCYFLIASALVFLGRRLGLTLPLILLAVIMFLNRESVIAGEWILWELEAKVIAYGLILWAMERMLNKSYRAMALLLGLATSFHVLVGGYATLTALGWIILRWKTRLPNTRDIIASVLFYLTGSLFAIGPILRQIAAPVVPTSALQPSYIYVFLRNPHHLNPFSWHLRPKPFLYLLILLLSFVILWWKRPADEPSEPYKSRSGLFEFTLLSLVPFAMGLAIAPFDREGHFLQYYPFRFGDVMLPLNTYLLTACAVQHLLTERPYLTVGAKKGLLVICMLILGAIYLNRAHIFAKDLSALRQFPSQQQGIDYDQRELFDWIKRNTPRDSIIVSPPTMTYFSWMSERATIAQFKLMPNTKKAILEWYQRLQDLSGNNSHWKDASFTAAARLARDYLSLTTAQAQKIMAKYKADYFLTSVKHKLELPIVHRNTSYVLYSREGSLFQRLHQPEAMKSAALNTLTSRKKTRICQSG